MDLKNKIEKYLECMEEVKKRVEVIESLINKTVATPYLITNVEFACIQIRKILELVALSGLVANKSEYQKIKMNLENLWNAKDIVKTLQVINPKFYPEPIVLQGFGGDPNNTRTQPVTSGYLTGDEFLDIYARCGGLLHAQNPFSRKKEFENTYKVIPSWLEKLKKLLNQHIVNLVDESHMIMVLMNFGYDANVSIGAYSKGPTDGLLHQTS
jgi:hypothetical protein